MERGLNEVCLFQQRSPLRLFLAKLVPDSHRCFFTLKEILILIKTYVVGKKLFGARNPNLIVTDKALGRALGCRLLHTSQISDLIRSKKTAVGQFRVTPSFLKIIKQVSTFKRQKVFLFRDILDLFKLYLRKNLHKIISSDNPQILRLDKEPFLYDCFRMKACHGRQLKAIMMSHMIPVHYKYQR